VSDMLVYPMEKVVGIAPDDATLDAVGEALSASGVDDDRVEVLSGREGEQRLDPKGEERGKLATALRTVQKALGEEAVRMEKLNDAVEAGQYVVQVEMPDLDDDEAYEAEKRSVGNALHDGGATDVAFYGKLAIEELQLGA
jgi:hypothetical protein